MCVCSVLVDKWKNLAINKGKKTSGSFCGRIVQHSKSGYRLVWVGVGLQGEASGEESKCWHPARHIRPVPPGISEDDLLAKFAPPPENSCESPTPEYPSEDEYACDGKLLHLHTNFIPFKLLITKLFTGALCEKKDDPNPYLLKWKKWKFAESTWEPLYVFRQTRMG
jgi:hypothetical protein